MIDLTAALTSYYDTTPNARGDEQYAHVSDLFGCDLATWARRSGRPQLPFDQPTHTKFALGNAVEDHVAKAIAQRLAELGYTLERNRVVALRFDDTGELAVVPFAADLDLREHIIGHVDYMLVHRALPPVLIECKSTSFLKGKQPTAARDHYIIQGAAYAVAVGAPRFAVFIVCRESGKVAEFWFDTADHIDDVRKRMMRVISSTAAQDAEPIAMPPYAWSCKYCTYGACARNKNPMRLEGVPF